MDKTNNFFSAPNLDDEESAIIPVEKDNNNFLDLSSFATDEIANTFLSANDNNDCSFYDTERYAASIKTGETSNIDVSSFLNDNEKAELSNIFSDTAPEPIVKSVTNDNPKDRVIIRFIAPDKNIANDIDVPLDITANDLIVGLNEAYHLDLDISDARQCYFSCENPIALLRGNKTLGEFGIRDGSLIAYYR